jgi:hypothetical protein
MNLQTTSLEDHKQNVLLGQASLNLGFPLDYKYIKFDQVGLT